MIPKPTKIRSKKIRDSARGEQCTFRYPGVCNGDAQTVVFCHVRNRYSGTGTKGNDIHGFYGCSDCHALYDGRTNKSYSPLAKSDRALAAMIETQMRLVEKGLIAVPR